MPLTFVDVSDQRQALKLLAHEVQRCAVLPQIHATARAIVALCPAKNDECEVETVFNAIKYGTPLVPFLRRGIRYTSEIADGDYFVAPDRMIEICNVGGCGGDCDCQAAFVACILASLGYFTGLRGWGKTKEDLSHVYAVVRLPKGDPNGQIVGLDTTVEESYVGWEPNFGETVTAWWR